MKIAIIQSPLMWENGTANRIHFEEKIASIEESELIILPEMFTSGFTMNPKQVAETMTGETISWMKDWANKKQSAICGSLVIKDNNQFYNRLVFIYPTGQIEYYDKRHLFTLAGENNEYSSGSEKKIIQYLGWKICLQICYDLRFPVFSRNVENYDLLLYVANWPEPRINAWDVLLKARAIENMCYVAGVNRVGEDNNGYQYPGHSQIVDCLGNYVIEPSVKEGIFISELDKNKLHETRKKFAFLNDRDDFTVN